MNVSFKISSLLSAFISAVCSPMCLNGGKCLRGNKCRCKKDFTGQYCELKNRYHKLFESRKDI